MGEAALGGSSVLQWSTFGNGTLSCKGTVPTGEPVFAAVALVVAFGGPAFAFPFLAFLGGGGVGASAGAWVLNKAR